MNVKDFEERIRLIKKHFNIVSYKEVCGGKLSSEKLNVLLTFDDGYRNNLTLAMPVLKKYDAPAVFFITATSAKYLFNDVLDIFPMIGPPETVLGGARFRKIKKFGVFRYKDEQGTQLATLYSRKDHSQRQQLLEEIFKIVPQEKFEQYGEYMDLLSPAEINELTVSGFDIGAHGLNHVDLSAVPDEELQAELYESKKRLETMTGVPCGCIAFPYGRYDERVMRACEEHGYHKLFGTDYLHRGEDLNFIIGRMTVNPYISAVSELAAIAKGSHD
jgi:peptidoglycan/xylan/chitin deacetylase (PgdA/CDA1 family)